MRWSWPPDICACPAVIPNIRAERLQLYAGAEPAISVSGTVSRRLDTVAWVRWLSSLVAGIRSLAVQATFIVRPCVG